MRKLSLFILAVLCASAVVAQTNNQKNPTWWEKYQYLIKNGEMAGGAATASVASGNNVDVSNECGPQSETYITLNTANPRNLAGGSNEIFRDPMRAYSSSDGGKSWTGTDIPLPPPIGANGIRFGSDPTLAFDSQGNLFYGPIVVFFGSANGVNGSEMRVPRPTDGGKTSSSPPYFDFPGGSDHFNDKPMITADANPSSPFRDRVYI